VEAQLRIPYRDTAARDLVWRLGETGHPALATMELDLAGGQLELRLLGHSHQVIFTPGRAAGPGPVQHCVGGRPAVISEVVACERASGGGDPGPRSGRAPGLPPTAERVIEGWAYRFRSHSHRLRPDRFGHWVDRLADRLVDHPDAIVGRFPGSPHAVTALLAGPGPGGAGVRWRTWHAYPQDGRLVSTSTTVRPR